MRQQSYHHRARGKRPVSGAILVVLAVLVGAAMVYGLIVWFRGQTESRNEKGSDATALNLDAALAAAGSPADVAASASMIRADGGNAGIVYRNGTLEAPDYRMIVSLPAIAPDGGAYEVWMVKDGLADVKSVGTLAPRADGTWSKEFSLVDAMLYPTVVIMFEPNDGNSAPSGSIVAQGVFE